MADALAGTALTDVGEIVEIRRRRRTQTRPLDRATAIAFGGGFLAFAAACAVRAHDLDARSLGLSIALVALYGIAYRTEFVAATGSAVPTEPVLVALLFTAPIGLVPAFVVAGLLLGGRLRAGETTLVHELLVRAASGWHCAGPVIVVWLAAIGEPRADRWGWLLLALGLQFTVDAAVAVVRCVALGVAPSRLVAPLRFTFTVDALLAPLAMCVVIATHPSFAVVLLTAVPVLLVRVLARDRAQHLATALTLGEALQSERGEARVDPLTGLANRRAWEEAVADAERGRDAAEHLTVEVLMADVDHLKRVNDTFGHDAGDDLLQAFATVLRDAAPGDAVVARIGGDEFGILRVGPGRALDELALRVRSVLPGRAIACGAPVSASFGVAGCPPESSVSDAVRHADTRLVADKQHRRAAR